MLNTMLTAAHIPHKPGRFPDPPEGTYAVTFDEVIVDGPDWLNMIYTHNCTVELYEPVLDPDAEAAFEAQLNANGLHYEKQPPYWLQNVQRYQVIYELTFIEKRRV